MQLIKDKRLQYIIILMVDYGIVLKEKKNVFAV